MIFLLHLYEIIFGGGVLLLLDRCSSDKKKKKEDVEKETGRFYVFEQSQRHTRCRLSSPGCHLLMLHRLLIKERTESIIDDRGSHIALHCE